ncbi:MAG: ribosomal protein [Dehalococcoidia bacterium]|nr:ribosomal protein [Dehalococcoidia bacterium]
MSRSIKKGPYVDVKLMKKITAMNQKGDKAVIRTWARACIVMPEMVGHTLAIHDGRRHVPVFMTENMVGHKLGEFALTRTFRGHTSRSERARAQQGRR